VSRRKVLALSLALAALSLAAPAAAQYIDVGGVQQLTEGFADAGIKALTYVAYFTIVFPLLAVILAILRREGLHTAFTHWYFWIPIFFVAAGAVFYYVGQISPPVAQLYQYITRHGCPFIYCPGPAAGGGGGGGGGG
jgi:hypothetical protein